MMIDNEELRSWPRKLQVQISERMSMAFIAMATWTTPKCFYRVLFCF